MAKKRSKKKERAQAEQQKTKTAQTDDEESKPFDFGGLPDRDLKKNLGCG